MTQQDGSNIKFPSRAPHLARRPSLGVPGEVNLLRAQLETQLGPLAALYSREFTNPVAAVTNAFVTAVTPPESGEGALVYQRNSSLPLNGSVASGDIPYGRNATVTTVGADTEFSFPFNVVVEGLDIDGVAQSETIAVAAAASPGTIAGNKIFTRIDKVTIPECSVSGGVGTVAVGFGAKLGLKYAPVVRAGVQNVLKEYAAGAAVTTGTLSATYRSYTPAAAPDATKSYYVLYEAEAPQVKVVP